MGLVFETVFCIFKLFASVVYLIFSIYCTYKFLTGDKEEKKTFWYGIAIIICLLAK